VLQLQRTVGNRAVARLLQIHAEELKAGLTGTASTHLGHNSSQSAIHPPAGGTIQTRLASNKRRDKYKDEAGRAAEQVRRLAEPGLQRQPGGSKKSNPPGKHIQPEWEIRLRPRPNEIEIVFSDFLFEREVLPIVFKAGKLPPGFTLVGGGGSSITTRWVLTGPSGQDLSSASSLFDEGVTTRLADERAKQRSLEQKQTAQLYEEGIRQARARFRARHDDHSVTVLDNIDRALIRVTQNNPHLLIAYYDYYADHKLTDEIENEKWAGATSSGNTDINPRVLELNSTFKTDDPLSLLGGTLIHEYVHTPQGAKGHGVEQAPKEAKAYAIEVFLAERMGDQKRADFIYQRRLNDVVDINTGSDKIFRATYNTMQALYKVIDSGRTQSDARVAGDISSEEARRMSVEFISRNEEDYGTKLKDFIAKHSL
jgi:hypothetical protein